VRQKDFVLLCEESRGGASLRLRLTLEPVQRQLLALDARLLVAVAAALLVFVILAGFLLERGVVRRLERVDEALERVGAEEPEAGELLAEGGDALGRLGAAVNRLAEQLRAERARTRGQIVTLQQANRLLADEKRALREAREDLVRSERLALVGRLAAGVAHEVGNPLSAVIAYAAILRERLKKLEGAQASEELAERIEREAARVDRILRDLLDLARPREARLEPLDLARMLERARVLLEPQPRWKDTGCALVVELPAELPCVLGEEHYVVQVFVNLLLNAAKAGARTVHVGAKDRGAEVLLELADDGRGIPPEDLPRLFEPFFTSAAPGEGTGLGLALCHATMERLGGSIAARAGVARGAVFELRFRPA
jgi:signal transduction histidine kinase